MSSLHRADDEQLCDLAGSHFPCVPYTHRVSLKYEQGMDHVYLASLFQVRQDQLVGPTHVYV